MTMQRHIYYSLIHHGIETLLQERMGYFDEAAYHRTLRTMTGKSSCFLICPTMNWTYWSKT